MITADQVNKFKSEVSKYPKDTLGIYVLKRVLKNSSKVAKLSQNIIVTNLIELNSAAGSYFEYFELKKNSEQIFELIMSRIDELSYNNWRENIRQEIEFYRDKLNKKLINKVKQSNNINQTKFAIVNDCLSMIISAKPKITDRNKEFWSLTEKLLFITSNFCHYPDDDSAEIVIELHSRLKNMPDSPCEGEELHLP
ncbi:36805_t:CDS:2, partial [Gigaspora margarita]